MARTRRFRASRKQRDLYRYRLRRGVQEAFTATRGKMRAAVQMQPAGAYDPLSIWDDDWWRASVNRHIAPALWEIYWEAAAESAAAAGRDPLAGYMEIEARWRAQVTRLYRYGDTVRRRVDVVSDQGTGESKGWMLDKLGLVAAAGPLSDGIAEGMVATEELEAVEGGTSAGLGGTGTKTWVASGPNPRESHSAADGQAVGFDEPFNVGGFDCMYPGDGDLPPEERVNCYCSVEYTFEPLRSESSAVNEMDELFDLLSNAEPLVPVVDEIAAAEPWRVADVVESSASMDTTLRKNPGRYTPGSEWGEMAPLTQRGNVKVVQGAIDETTALIDSVHGMPADLPPVSWHQLPNNVDMDGKFQYLVGEGPTERMLGIRGGSEILHEVVAHESGHYFDWANFDTPAGTWASGKPDMVGGWWRSGEWQPVESLSVKGVSPALQDVMDTIVASPEFREYERMMMAIGPDGPGAIGSGMSMARWETLQYLTDPQELFARAYAQFVALETGNTALMGNVARGLLGEVATQWELESFLPIHVAFKRMFRAAGLAR